jgi:phosphate transport system protein
MLLKMGEQVEISIHKALKAFEKREVTVAQEVIREDHHVDEMEEKIDDTVVKLIATQQPVATDLRKILMAMKIASDLERIADHATNIAESVVYMETGKQMDLN